MKGDAFIIYAVPNGKATGFDTSCVPLTKGCDYKIFYDENAGNWAIATEKMPDRNFDKTTMTTDEVIRDLKKLRSFHNGSYGEACNIAIEAVEKMAGTPKKRPSFLPCKCGKNRRWHYMTNSDGNLGIYYECMSCGFVSPSGKNERDAREKWNEAVKEASK